MSISEYVSSADPNGIFQILSESYRQIEDAWDSTLPESLGTIENRIASSGSIIFSGAGDSAVIGDLLQNFLQSEMEFPFFVNRSSILPAYANEDTLLVLASYSGNTEETISIFNEALEKNCPIIAMGSGGKIELMAEDLEIPFLRLKKGLQSRYALYSGFFTFLKLVQKIGLVPAQDEIVENIINLFKIKAEEYAEENNIAYTFATLLSGFIPVIYSAESITSAAGYRMRCQFNENSKQMCFHNVIPEMNHNEISGWEGYLQTDFKTKIISLIDEAYPPKVKHRFELTGELLQSKGLEVISLVSGEETLKERLLDTIYLGDWMSYYLAVINGINPAVTSNISLLKERLEKK